MIKQVCKTVDSNLEAETWGTNSGPAIGGGVPAAFGTELLPDGSRRFHTIGGPYTDWLASCHRPVPVNAGILSLSYEIKTDSNAARVAQAIETDTRVSVAKFNYNFSSQFNYQRGGMLQVASSDGSAWLDTGIKPGLFAAGLWIPVQFDYAFHVTTETYDFITVTINGVRTAFGSSFHGMKARSLNWADSCSLQVQQDLNYAGGSFEMFMKNISYTWA